MKWFPLTIWKGTGNIFHLWCGKRYWRGSPCETTGDHQKDEEGERDESALSVPGYRLRLSQCAKMGSPGVEEWHPLKLHHFAEHAHGLCDISQVSAYNKGLALSERPTWCLWPFAIGLGISLKTSAARAHQNISEAIPWKLSGSKCYSYCRIY